ncbi:unnamed protein product, partial [Choristocarpus tenellus]
MDQVRTLRESSVFSFSPYVQETVSSDADILTAVNVEAFPDGRAVSLEATFGNSLVFDETTGDLISSEAMIQIYNLQSEFDGDTDESLEWQDKYLSAMEVQV